MQQKISSSTRASDKEVSQLDLTVAGTKEAINMVESGAKDRQGHLFCKHFFEGT